MKLVEAYDQALNEEEDPLEREEVSSDADLKGLMVEEIISAMKEIRDSNAENRTTVDMIKPLFGCVAFWFIMGIRCGKILRDAELASK